MPPSDASGLMLQVRRYHGAPRPNDLRGDFLELVRELGVAGNKAVILAHECAHASMSTVWPATLNALIREHNRRAALGDIRLLGLKARACRELLLEAV